MAVILLFPDLTNKSMNDKELINHLKQAAEDLLWLSKSDSLWLAVDWGIILVIKKVALT